jgi:hypothetical protein
MRTVPPSSAASDAIACRCAREIASESHDEGKTPIPAIDNAVETIQPQKKANN